MDLAKLITIVQEYDEIYDLKNPYYSNQLRRENIWDEIGQRMNASGQMCKERWGRIRDNHRKALNLRKTKSGQAASKMKPPKYSNELSFLTPYLNDEEQRRSNIGPPPISLSLPLVEEEEEGLPDSVPEAPLLSPPPGMPMSEEPIKKTRKRPQEAETPTRPTTAATVMQEYLASKQKKTNVEDPLLEFFSCMGKTVKTFPSLDQIQIKTQLFEMVTNVERRLATEQILELGLPVYVADSQEQ